MAAIVAYCIDWLHASIQKIRCGAIQPEDAAREEGVVSEYKVHYRTGWLQTMGTMDHL